MKTRRRAKVILAAEVDAAMAPYDTDQSGRLNFGEFLVMLNDASEFQVEPVSECSVVIVYSITHGNHPEWIALTPLDGCPTHAGGWESPCSPLLLPYMDV